MYKCPERANSWPQWRGFLLKVQEWCQTISDRGVQEGLRLLHGAIFHSSPPDRIRLWMPTQPLNYSWGRTHHYNEHLSPKMSHLQLDYFVSKIGFSGSDQVNLTICFSWLDCWRFLQAAPKPLLQRALPEGLRAAKVWNLSLENLRLEPKAHWPQWRGFLLKFNEVQLLFLTGQQLGIAARHKSDSFLKLQPLF